MTETDESDPTAHGDVAPEDVEGAAQMMRLGEVVYDPSFELLVGQMIERGLASNDDPFKAVRTLLEMLERYCGDWDTGFVLLSLIASPPTLTDDSPYAVIADDDARIKLALAVQRMGGLYGHELQIGLDLSSRNPRDWQYIKTRTIYDLDAATWAIEVNMRFFNQDEVGIVGDPLSILRLTNNLMIALGGLGRQATDFADLMDEEATDGFASLASELLAMLQGESPDLDQDPDVEPDR